MIAMIYLKPMSFGQDPMVSIAIRSIGFKVDKTNLDARIVSFFDKLDNSEHIGEHRDVYSYRSFLLNHVVSSTPIYFQTPSGHRGTYEIVQSNYVATIEL